MKRNEKSRPFRLVYEHAASLPIYSLKPEEISRIFFLFCFTQRSEKCEKRIERRNSLGRIIDLGSFSNSDPTIYRRRHLQYATRSGEKSKTLRVARGYIHPRPPFHFTLRCSQEPRSLFHAPLKSAAKLIVRLLSNETRRGILYHKMEVYPD